MIRFFRHIRKSLMEHPSKGRKGNKLCTPASPAGRYLFYAIGEILLRLLTKTCPVRAYLSVEIKMPTTTPCAVRYNLCRNIYSSLKHLAYLRHAGPYLYSGFYRYVVPTGQFLSPSAKSFNPIKSVIPC